MGQAVRTYAGLGMAPIFGRVGCFRRVGMGSLLARVHLERASCGLASGLELLGPHGLAVARGGDSSAKGRACRRPRV